MGATDLTVIQEYTSVGGFSYVNLLHFVNIGGTFDGDTMDAIVNSWGVEVVQNTLSEDLIASGDVRCTLGFPEVTDELYSSTDDHVGQATGELYAANAAFLVSLSAGSGRRKKGRLYVPGLTETKVADGGFLNGTASSDLLTNVSDFITDVATNHGYLLGVASRVDGVTRAVESLTVSSYIATQRRRLNRVAYP